MNSWDDFFSQIKDKKYFKDLIKFLDFEYSNYKIYPPRNELCKAFKLTSPMNIKVVIIGQDPYHEENQAMGLSFSVPSTTKLPPSLKNIFKEIGNDLNLNMKNNGDLTYLAKQGVFLFNSYLTVRAHEPLSHKIIEYELFDIDLIKYLNDLNQPIAFMLWGNFAKKYFKYLTNSNHLILLSSHPSPLSANRGGWFNRHQFSKVNEFLTSKGANPIDWQN